MIFRRSCESTLIKIGLIGLIGPIGLILSNCAMAPKKAEVAAVQDHFAEIDPVPLVMNSRVEDWLRYFQGPSRERFERYLSRSGRYIPMMKRILLEYRLPEDLVYLAMIESGFNPHAYSRARATGTWQFIYRTGVRYGLRADSWIDERRDPEKSTIAAAKYLKDLYDRFNDWHLAAAGYNAGEGKIGRAIKRYRTEDFWEMSRQRYLKSETKNYVPKMIAAALISKNPAEFGFEHVRYEDPILFDTVVMQGPTDLRVAAQCIGVSYEVLKGLNPELLTWVTPPNAPDYQLKVPQGTAELFQVRYAALTPEERLAETVYEAKGAETVRQVARRHSMPANFVAALNFRSPDARILKGEKILIPRLPPEGERFREKHFAETGRKKSGETVYRVRRGDSLNRISLRLGVKAAALKNLNPHVDWDRLQSGKTIRLAVNHKSRKVTIPPLMPKAEAATKNENSTSANSASGNLSLQWHTVQQGETLWEIAQQYGVAVSQLKKWNAISNHRGIRAGRRLKIYPRVADPRVTDPSSNS